MTQLTLVLNHRHGSTVDPRTVAAVCIGIADLCRFQVVEVRGARMEVRAKVQRIRQGSLKFVFDLQPLTDAITSGFGVGVASSIAATAIVGAFAWLYSKSAHGRSARAHELADALKSPEVTGALREMFSALQQDTAITSIKAEAEGESVKFSAAQIERTEALLAASEWGMARGEHVLWGKHVRIVGIMGESPNQEWRIHWNSDDKTHEQWVKAPRIPSDQTWWPGVDRTLVVDLKTKFRGDGHYQVVEYAEILNVHWTQTS